MPMKSDEWLQYVTEQLIEYIESPRKARRKPKSARESWSSKWFGIVPMSLGIWSQNTRLRKISKMNWKRWKLKRNPRI